MNAKKTPRNAKTGIPTRPNHTINMDAQADAYRGEERLGQFQLLADWKVEEIQQWVLVSHQKEDDNLALEKYRKQARF